MVVGRIQNLAYRFRHRFCFYGFNVLTSGKSRHIEAHRSSRAPQTQGVDGVASVTRYVHIVRNRQNYGRAFLFDVQFPVRPGFFQMSAEFNFAGVFFSRIKPDVAVLQPVVGKFHLPTVHYSLFENTVVVTDTETACGISAGSKTVHVCGGKSA